MVTTVVGSLSTIDFSRDSRKSGKERAARGGREAGQEWGLRLQDPIDKADIH